MQEVEEEGPMKESLDMGEDGGGSRGGGGGEWRGGCASILALS